jgi:sulfate-transporting ATPase
MVGIARAMATSPRILLLDEPAAGLDDHESAELATMVRRLADEWGIAVLLIEHDMNFVFGACDRITVLQSGRQIATGSTDEIRDDPAVIEAYLGDETEEGALESAVAGPAPRTVSKVSP